MEQIFGAMNMIRWILMGFTFTLAVSLGAAPANDNFANRFALVGSSITVTGYNSGASKQTGEPTIKFDTGGSNTGGKSVWWKWTAPATGPTRISTIGSMFDTILGVYTGSELASLVWVAGNDDSGGSLTSMVLINAAAGTEYQITVDSYSGGTASTIVLNVNMSNSPPSIYLAGPINGATFSEPATIALSAFASDYNTTAYYISGVTNVVFYHDGVQITNATPGSLVTSYSGTWTGVAQGTYTLTAVSYNTSGLMATSAPVVVTVNPNTPPIVSLTSPPNGTTIYAPATIALAATASDPGGKVSTVEFWQGTTQLGTATNSPYTFSWPGVAPGNYTLTAVAVDNGGLRATSAPVSIVVLPNVPPTVSITSPTNGQSFVYPSPVTNYVTVTDNPGGSITNIEFYQGATKLGQTTTSPYTFVCGNLAIGTYTLTAVAWDNGGLSATSAPVVITIAPNMPPLVSLTSPTNGTGRVAPATVVVMANASDPDGVVTNVDFYANTTRLTQKASSPYAYLWSGVTPGTYLLTAVAYDGAGLTATSAPVTLYVSNTAPPTVTIRSPVNAATFFEPLNLALLVTAADSDGTVAKVEYFSSATKIGESTVSPFGFIWTNLLAGNYTLTAIATDNSGTKGTSSVVTVSVGALASDQTNMLAAESIWKYLDNGSDQGTAWRGLNFNDSTWSSGKAQLGYGDGDEVTTNSFGTDPNNKFITTYFRQTIVLTNVYRYSNLTLRVIRDDGAAVYINSNEVFRSNLPEGALNYLSLAPQPTVGPDESINWYTTNFVPGANLLRNGTNVIAVEIHQDAGNSSDISFDLELIGSLSPPTNQWPTVTLSSPADGSVYYVSAPITISAAASDVDGTITNVAFYWNGQLLNMHATPPYSSTMTPPPGTYTFIAVAYDNNGATNASAPATVTVDALPTVSIINPTNNAVFDGPTNILLEATASDSDGTILQVEFFRNTITLGVATSAPYRVTWMNAIAGSYTLRAVATDNLYGTSTSAPVTVNVTSGGSVTTWVAYNDHVPGVIGTQTSPNATIWNVQGSSPGSAGYLKDVVANTNTPVYLTITRTPNVSFGGSGGVPAIGTPLYTTFNGYVYFGDGTACSPQIPPGDNVTYTFTGLNPNRRYSLRAGAIRGGAGYTNRWTKIELGGADSSVSAHTANAITRLQAPSDLTDNQAAFCWGINNTANTGDMADWEYINPGADGTISLISTMYTGFVPNGGSSTAGDPPYGYAVTGIRLEESEVIPARRTFTVTVVNPTNNSAYNSPANVTVSADVVINYGSVTNFEFYTNSVLLARYLTPPYTLNWSNIIAGTYVLTAIAADNNGNRSTSAPVTMTVSGNAVPLVALTSPTNNSMLSALQPILLTATASDLDGTVTNVEFYQGTTRLGQDQTAPYSFLWASPPQGNFVLQVVATDNQGTRGTSAPVNVTLVTNFPPSVAITDPANNTTVSSAGSITIAATASDTDGTVIGIQFYQGTTLIGMDATSPFSMVWSNLSPGNYVLTAVAQDNSGGRATSAPVNVTVIQAASRMWMAYNDQGAIGNANDTSYTIPSFGAYSGPLKNIDTGEVLPVYLTMSYSGNVDGAGTMSSPMPGTPADTNFAPYINWTASSGGVPPGLHVWTGASVTYAFSGLDPNRVYRFIGTSMRGGNPGGGGPNYYSNRWTRAELVGATSYVSANSAGVITSAQFPGDLTASQAAWNSGVNIVGDVIVWDQIAPSPGGAFSVICTKYSGAFPGGIAANGSDCYPFNALRLEEFAVSGPLVVITSPGNNSLVLLPGNMTINAVVSGFSGTVTNVSFYNWPVLLGQSTTPPFSFTLSNPPLGVYTLRAVAQDTTGLLSTSAPVRVTVQSNRPPSIAIASPADETVFSVPANIDLQVLASDPDGAVTIVQYFANGSYLDENNVPPYNITWPAVPIGDYNLTAVAWDTGGLAATSSVVHVYVRTSSAPTVVSFVPAPGSVSNLNQITVNFTEPLGGLEAADFLINGIPATSMTGAGLSYTFSFATPLEGTVIASWAPNHGIHDFENPPQPFNGMLTNEIAFYDYSDSVPPTVTAIYPQPGVTVPNLTRVEVTFSEPVTGVNASDLLVNGIPATKVTGSMAGPYVFKFIAPEPGVTEVEWVPNHGIRDVSLARNPFAGGLWTYTVNPGQPETSVVLNEIYYHPPSENFAEQWVELYNRGAGAVDLTGWSIDGLNFAFPSLSLAGGAYLVVAADVLTFNSNYPEVTNVIGGFSGEMKKHLQLLDAAGNVVSEVHFAKGGDWGERLYGSSEKLALSLTRNGSTAHVTVDTYASGDTFVISGADQPEYNGTFVTSGATYTGFNYTVPGTPVSPATGTILVRQITDWNRVGWTWSSRADGLGSSLELINPNLPADYGQNWQANNLAGTPGRANSVSSTNIAPLILNVQHFPIVPRSTNTISITARILDEHTTGITATLWYRVDALTPPAFSSTTMYDDGAHQDGIAGDGVYGAILPAQANNTVIEFYVQASDAEGNSRTWPAPALDGNRLPMAQDITTRTNSPNALLQVDDNPANAYDGEFPVYKIIMRAADTNYYTPFPNSYPRSDAQMNLTFICLDGTASECIYLCDVRDRGAGTRNGQPANYRLAFRPDQKWRGLNSIELNNRFTHSQLAGYAMSAITGVNAEWGRVVKVRYNNQDRASSGLPQYGMYIQLQPTDGDYARSHFPEDPDGNLYRGQAPGILGGALHACNLSYLGTNWMSYANVGYSHQSGTNDWSDLATLCAVLNTNTPDDAVYAAAVRKIVNVDQWMRFFALFTMTLSRETSIATGNGDDYSMYRGLKDPRFILLAHDWDTIFNEGDTTGGYTDSIFRMAPGANMTVLTRFMRHPEFVSSYYRELKRMCDGPFTQGQLGATLQSVLGGFVPQATINNMVNFGVNRRNYVLSVIPLQFTVNSSLTQSSGYYYTTSPSATFYGQANAIDTRSVTINGAAGAWSTWEGRWTNSVSLQPGINRLLIECRDTNGVAFTTTNIDVWYDVTGQSVSGTLSGSVVWSASAGPYRVTANVTVANDATLTIQPGASVFFASGTTLTVTGSGRVLAEGTPAQHIRFTRVPGGANWGSFDFIGATNESRWAYVDIDSCGGTTIGGHNAEVHVNGASRIFFDHVNFVSSPVIEYISFDGSSFIVQNCVFPSYPAPSGPEMLHGINGIPAGGYGIFRDNYFGHTWGFNDTIDFTGGNRPGPILQIINNVFDGASDDCLDLDSTDAWIEGNVFMHVHRDPARTDNALDTSSAISGGVDFAGQYSDWTVINNIFFDVDHVFLNKSQLGGGGRVAMFNNTVVHVNKEYSGSTWAEIGAFDWSDDSTGPAPASAGSGLYAAENIIYDCPVLNVTNSYLPNLSNYTIIMDNNILSVPWTGAGSGNQVIDPMLNLGTLAGTAWTNATLAQVRAACKLLPGSPALGAGFGGRDLGGLNPHGIAIAGEPEGLTPTNSAALSVGLGGIFNWGAWPAQAWGWTAFKWKLDNGAWSGEVAVTNTSPFTNPATITLSGLSMGPHTVYVSGKNDAPPGYYQDDTFLYPANAGVPTNVTASSTWIVNPSAITLRINEVLAWNSGAVQIGGKTPDLIELYNPGPGPVDLTGMRLSDDLQNPTKYVFTAGPVLGPQSYLVLFADSDTTPLGYHLGFALAKEGSGLYLFTPTGQLLDSVVFGPQVPDWSIGRLSDGSWGLTYPTLGAKNRPAPLGDVHKLKINEWLTDASQVYPSDFIELFNTDPLPVSLGGLYVTDTPINAPDRDQISALSFVLGYGYAVLIPDGNPKAGPMHLNFKLAPERGEIALFDTNLSLIDYILYGPQRTDISQGRSPSASTNIVFFTSPTPGAPNPAPPPPGGLQLVINEVLAKNTGGLTNVDGGTPSWLELYNPTASSIDLGDMSVSDIAGTPRLYAFPAGLSIASGAYMVVLFDPSQPPSSNVVARPNAGFGIPGNGGTLYLYDKPANGGALLDRITYGMQANDYSVGRLPTGSTNWALNLPTPGSINLPASVGDYSQVRINEWMAWPSSGQDWFELYNPNPQPVNISGMYLTDDVSTPQSRQKSLIAPLSFIGTGLYGYARFWADKNLAAGPDHADFAMSAGGEQLGLTAPGDIQIDAITFPTQAQGVSEGRLPDGSTNIVRFPNTPTPGEANYLPITNIVINEVLSAVVPNSSFEQAIELLNVSASSVNIGGWYISNMKHQLFKYRIPNGTTIPAGQFKVFYESQFNFDPADASCFNLDAIKGDNVYLAGADANGALTGYRLAQDFGPAEPGVPFGRYTNYVELVTNWLGEVTGTIPHLDFPALSRPTFGIDNPDGIPDFELGHGAPNAYPKVGPVVFAEIMYHPPQLLGADNLRDEYLRILNITSNTVTLYDPAYPSNTWHLRGGVDYNFPIGVSLGAGQSLLLVAFDPVLDTNSLAGFRSAYPGLDPGMPLYGPYSGKLNNGGDTVELNKPGTPVPAGQLNAGQVPRILVEHVKYNDTAPWDPQADGSGKSLQRINAAAYGNDPFNWVAAPPLSSGDSDGDGIPDTWTIQYFGHPTGQAADQSRSFDDPDHDGMTNLQEYQAGTDPTNPSSNLRLFIADGQPATNVVLHFEGLATKAYSVGYKDALPANWQTLVNLNPLLINGTVWVTNALPADVKVRFYRVVVQPAP